MKAELKAARNRHIKGLVADHETELERLNKAVSYHRKCIRELREEQIDLIYK